MSEILKVRLDRYLWAIRIYASRSQATRAIDAGKVKLHGVAVKPAHWTAVGEQYDIRAETRKWIIEVTALIEKRVAYTEAVKHYMDKTPPEVLAMKHATYAHQTGKRISKTGRPTKKNRRDMDGMQGE